MQLFRKIAIIFLIVGILSPTGIVDFSFSIPKIIEHYNHHNQEHQSIGFVEFLVQHVSDNDHHDSHPEHNDFPLHHNHSSACVPILMAFIPMNTPSYELCNTHCEIDESDCINYTEPFNSSEFRSSIWQPPQA